MSVEKRLAPRSTMTEKTRCRLLLGDFKAEGSAGLKFISKIYPYEPCRSVLIALGTIFSGLTGKVLERDYCRKKELIIKWFDENLEECLRWESHVKLIFGEYKMFIDESHQKKRRKRVLRKNKPKKWDDKDFKVDDPFNKIV